ncbi:hypothetical protein GE061_012235 [Apolygus lucorum]|uniref:Regucalcin n=1 Tax=Apolygus lucorum TaxID=248454 RepID=A0A8S9XRS1_APOLU|nr:hypothetical protein GE061_012235 [Apolygus lucorum]
MYKIERLNIDGIGLGEGPHWDMETNSLFFVDLRVGKIHMYTPSTERSISIKTWDGPTTFIVPVKGKKDHFVIGEKLDVTLIHWDTTNNKIVSKEVLATVPDPPTNRLNDAKCDSTGRLWLGTMTNANGKDIVDGGGFFYSYTKKGGVKLHLKNITISNGIATSSNNKKFLFIDSGKYTVDEFDFDINLGEISNLKTVFDVKKNSISGLPDGMTIDSDGNLWVALFGGAKIIQDDMKPKIERLPIEAVGLGEGPHWDVESQSLFFVDLRVGKIHMYTPATNRSISIETWKGPTSFIVPVKGKKDHFVVGEKLDVTLIHWDTTSNKIVAKEVLAKLPEIATNRINDAKCDATGRLWLGTMTDANGDDIIPKDGALYSYTKKDGVSLHLKLVTISNGIAISSDNKKFWYIDSAKYTVDGYDFDIDKGKISNLKMVFDVKKNSIPGLPDGMCIDTEGNVWVALFGGARVIHVNPTTGALLHNIEIPTAHQITSCAFGGPNLDELYVTSANDAVTPEDEVKYTEKGSTFRITGLGVKGYAGNDIDLSSSDVAIR